MAGRAWTRRDFLTRSATVGGLTVAGSVFAACTSTSTGGSALADARRTGTIKVGIAGEVPYGFTEKGRVTGEAPEVARVVFGRLGIHDMRAQQVEFDSLIGGLNAHLFDVVSAGMFITPQRCLQAAFSSPDYLAPEAFLVPKGNPQQVLQFSDLTTKRLKVAVLSGAVEQSYAQRSGVPADLIQVTGDQVGMLQEVLNGRVYAAALTNISLNWLVRQNPAAPVEVTPAFNPVIDGVQVRSAGAFVFRTSDNDLREAFNRELHTIHADGQWLQVAAPFGFAQPNIPGPDLTTEQLCRAPAG